MLVVGDRGLNKVQFLLNSSERASLCCLRTLVMLAMMSWVEAGAGETGTGARTEAGDGAGADFLLDFAAIFVLFGKNMFSVH